VKKFFVKKILLRFFIPDFTNFTLKFSTNIFIIIFPARGKINENENEKEH